MSIDLAQSGRGVFRLNFQQLPNIERTQVCRATQEFKFGNLIEKSDDYMLAIERLYVPIQGIPMVQGINPAIIFHPLGPGIIFTINYDTHYSLGAWIDNLNDQGEILFDDLTFKIDGAGRIVIRFSNFVGYSMTLNQQFADICDLNILITGANADAAGRVRGRTSILDRFDQLQKIQVEAIGMNIVQEIIDTDRSLPILTDILVPRTYNISRNFDETFAASIPDKFINLSYPVRQALIYNAEGERRFVNLKGQSPIQNIILECVAIYKDGTRHEIIIPPREIFTCKIDFYKK
ncbi:MAG: hypothetical protein GY756_20365 [bacterium]|nr:hypothetical protein [bacterium]